MPETDSFHYGDLEPDPGLPNVGDILRWREIAAQQPNQQGSDWELVGVEMEPGGKVMGFFRKRGAKGAE